MYSVDWSLLEPVWQDHPTVIAAWAFGSAQTGIIPTGGRLGHRCALCRPAFAGNTHIVSR
jgi:hypothetical protein